LVQSVLAGRDLEWGQTHEALRRSFAWSSKRGPDRVREQAKNREVQMNRVTAAFVMAFLGAGCGASDDMDAEENIGEVQAALSNTSWALSGPIGVPPAPPQPPGLMSPVAASKRVAGSNFNIWTIARDGNTNVLKFSAFVSQGSSNLTWMNVDGATSVSAHGATSWMGCGGADSNRNVAIGWIDFSGNAKVQISSSTNASGNFLSTPMNLGSGNSTGYIPALAQVNNKLFMVTTIPVAAPNADKRRYRYKYISTDCDSTVGSWSSWINLPEGWFGGGPAAAATSSNGLTVAGVGSDTCTGGPNSGFCSAWLAKISVPTDPNTPPSLTIGWTQIPLSTAQFTPFTTLGMVSSSDTNTGGARLVASGGTNVWTATTTSATSTSSWSALGNSGCTSVLSNPMLAMEKNVNTTFRVVSGCNPGESVRFTTLTP
jgi:hypothetical protein